jgi:hypothetical protein
VQPQEPAGTQDVSTRGRAAKRARRSEPQPQGVQQPQQHDIGAAALPASNVGGVDTERLAPLTTSHVVPVSVTSLPVPTAVQLPEPVLEPPKEQLLPSKEEQQAHTAPAAVAGPGSGGSNSVEGTQGTAQTGFHLPDSNNPSPTEVDAWHPPHEQEQRLEQQQQAAPSHVLIPPPRLPSGTSVGVQAGGGVLLPPSLLALRGANEAMSAPFNSVSPHDLLLRGVSLSSAATGAQLLSHDPAAPGLCTASQGLNSSGPGPQGSGLPVTDKVVEGLIAAAQARKRKADAERGPGPWTIPTITLYVESCLMFVDACVAKMAVPPRSPEDRNARALA